MKKIISGALMILALSLLGCSSSSSEDKKETPKVTTVTVVADKTTIVADGTDAALLTAKVLDQSSNVMNDQIIEYYNGETKLLSNKFTTTSAGAYSIYAKVGAVKSSELKITATLAVNMKVEFTGRSTPEFLGGVTYNITVFNKAIKSVKVYALTDTDPYLKATLTDIELNKLYSKVVSILKETKTMRVEALDADGKVIETKDIGI